MKETEDPRTWSTAHLKRVMKYTHDRLTRQMCYGIIINRGHQW